MQLEAENYRLQDALEGIPRGITPKISNGNGTHLSSSHDMLMSTRVPRPPGGDCTYRLINVSENCLLPH